MVIDGKKLTVKFFLNKEVKGKRINVGPNTKYPLYIRVTYNRSSTKFIAGNNWFDESVEADLEEMPTLKGVKSAIEKIVEYEVKNASGKYKIVGLGDRMKTYSSNLSDAINQSLLTVLSKEVGKSMPYIEYQNWTKIEFRGRVKKGLQFLGKDLPNNIKTHAVLADLLDKLGKSISVFGWIMSDERLSFIERLRKIGSLYSEEKSIPLAFDYIPMIGLDKEEGIQEIVSLLNDVCSQLLQIKYTSFIEAKSISYDDVEKAFKVKLK